MRGDGDGWVQCRMGHRHWGLHSAAGLLACHVDTDGVVHVLLQQRSWLSHHGNTWAVPGGARDSNETAEQTAVREAVEEAGLDPLALRIFGNFDDPHGGWTYTTVLATAPGLLPVVATWESHELRWVPVDDVDHLPLHPGFAGTWPELRRNLRPLRLVVDAANVMGSRPDGWWRDRAGAAARLRDQLATLAARGIPAAALAALPAPITRDDRAGGLAVTYPEIVLVVEGKARAVAAEPSGHPLVRVVAARDGGDDEVVAQAAVPGAIVLVVTADRALRSRVAGAGVAGPGWLLGLLDG